MTLKCNKDTNECVASVLHLKMLVSQWLRLKAWMGGRMATRSRRAQFKTMIG